jgi:hypothetical protein
MNVTVRDMSSGRERVIAGSPERNKNYALIDAGKKVGIRHDWTT